MDDMSKTEEPAKASAGCVKLFFLAAGALGVAFALGWGLERLINGS